MTQILPRFTDTSIIHDPLEIRLAAIEAKRHDAITALAHGGVPVGAEAAQLRGIPVMAKGISGTSPQTDPLRETIRRNTPRHRT